MSSTEHVTTFEKTDPEADTRTEAELRAALERIQAAQSRELAELISRQSLERVASQKTLARRQSDQKYELGKTQALLDSQLAERTEVARLLAERQRSEKKRLTDQQKEWCAALRQKITLARQREYAKAESNRKHLARLDRMQGAVQRAERKHAEKQQAKRAAELEQAEREANRD